jgi:microcystin degradation protein MlrC
MALRLNKEIGSPQVRIAIGQLWQETNTLNPLRTTRADFEQFGVTRGAAMVEQMATTNELGGFIQSLRSWPEHPEIVGLVRLPAWPSGTAAAETFQWLREEMIDALRKAMPVDAVLLALHGAMAAEEHWDVEGEILEAVREVIGPQTPLVATLDLHANLTEQMVRAADALVLYHTAPHVDVYETGQRGAAVLRRILIEGARPTTAFQKIPAVYPVQRANTEAESGVSFEMKRKLINLESRPEVLTAGLATVQPWLDIPQLGSGVLVTTDGQPELAATLCAELADELWQRRQEYMPDLLSIEESVRRAHEVSNGLTVLSDAADATTSGAPGDSVWILEELLKYDWPRAALVTLVSPEIVEQAEQRGAGAACEVELGGVRDNRFGTRVKVQATIERLFDARFVLSGHIGKNMAIDMGRCAVLRTGNVYVIVTSRSGPHFAPELFRAAGYEPFDASVLVAKSPCGFRAAYTAHAKQIFNVQSPGCAPSDFWNYPFEKIPRPLWPWDNIDTWRAEPKMFGLVPT